MATGKNSRSLLTKSVNNEKTTKSKEKKDSDSDFEDQNRANTATAKGREKTGKSKPTAFDEEDLEYGNGSSAGLMEGLMRKRDNDNNANQLPLRKANNALHTSFVRAMEIHEGPLLYVDKKVENAIANGKFEIKFMLSDVEGLGSSSHADYVSFIQLLDILGYTAKYKNDNEDNKEKDRFYPSTTIYLNWLPRKR